MENRLFTEAQADIKKSLEDKIKSTIIHGIKAKAKNTREIERLTARNVAIDDNIEQLSAKYEEGKFVETSDIDTFVSQQTEEMNDGFIRTTSGNKLRI